MKAVNDNTTTHDAREVQRELLPRAVPRFEGLELAGVCRPAIAVGGDCYDYLEHADGRPGLVIADISGKGVPAALLMASLQASVRSLFHLAADPGRDSIRVVAQALNVDSTIDGDLLAAAQELVVTGDARIAGGVVAAGRRVEIDGTVEGGARVAAGEIVIRGTLHGDANVIADRLDLAPGARITGDLDYRTRTPLSPEAAARVDGAVRYEDPPVDEDDEGTVWDVLFWFWQTLAALLTGILVVALFRGVVQRLVVSIAEETTLGALAFLMLMTRCAPSRGVQTRTTIVASRNSMGAIYVTATNPDVVPARFLTSS